MLQSIGSPNPPPSYVQTFLGTGTSQWYPFMTPQGARMVHILAVGGGGGGSNGFAAAASTQAPGGGGGGSGGIVSLLVPATFLPQIMYVQPGAGGAVAGDGGHSYVCIFPRSTNAGEIIVQSETVAAKGSANATSIAAGTAGAGGTISTIGLGYNSQAGLWQAYAGVAGVAGGTASGGTGNSITPATFVTGGAGGGSTSTSVAFAGGAINASGINLGLAGGALGTGTNTAGNGQSGTDVVSVDIPSEPLALMLYGGSGGGSNRGTTSIGGNGGNGAPGCGGGGGGGASGATSPVAGSGGLGGPGFVRIMCW